MVDSDRSEWDLSDVTSDFKTSHSVISYHKKKPKIYENLNDFEMRWNWIKCKIVLNFHVRIYNTVMR